MARELLGSSHPLARVEERLDAVATRLLAVAALFVAGVAARPDGVPVGLSLAIASSFDSIRDEAFHPSPRQARVRPLHDPRIITPRQPS